MKILIQKSSNIIYAIFPDSVAVTQTDATLTADGLNLGDFGNVNYLLVPVQNSEVPKNIESMKYVYEDGKILKLPGESQAVLGGNPVRRSNSVGVVR